ncbi:MAG TPA: phosphopantetheine-binding protein [Alcaligenes sp.]|nr:phosphopantetheine-binding protein [Alcaligenes sp.]HRL26922.1 phosphopantetheine-binding protein [Alcaligenes sp.]
MSDEIKSRIVEYLKEAIKPRELEINAQTELIESGIVDSLNIVNLVLLLEELSGTSIAFEELDLDDMVSVDAMVAKFFLDKELG